MPEPPHGGYKADISIFINGVEVFALGGSVSGQSGYDWTDLTVGEDLRGDEGSGFTLSDVAVKGAYYTDTSLDVIEIANEVYVPPEPTALALLALGVAGVALRRRAA